MPLWYKQEINEVQDTEGIRKTPKKDLDEEMTWSRLQGSML